MAADRRALSAAAAVRRMGLLASALGSGWYFALMLPLRPALGMGRICGHAATAAPHCAPCYAALALTGVGLALVTAPTLTARPAFSHRR